MCVCVCVCACTDGETLKDLTIRDVDKILSNELNGVSMTAVSLLLATNLALTLEFANPNEETWDVNIIGISILGSFQFFLCILFMYHFFVLGKTKWRVHLIACSWYLGLVLYFWSVGYKDVPVCGATYVPAPWAVTKVDAYGWSRYLYLTAFSLAGCMCVFPWVSFFFFHKDLTFVPDLAYYGNTAVSMASQAFAATIAAPLWTELFLRFNKVQGVGGSTLANIGQSIPFFVALFQFVCECWPLVVWFCPWLKDSPIPDGPVVTEAE